MVRGPEGEPGCKTLHVPGVEGPCSLGVPKQCFHLQRIRKNISTLLHKNIQLSPCFMARDNKAQQGVGPSASQAGKVLLVPGPQCPYFMLACGPQHQPCASPGALATAAPAGLPGMFRLPGSGARAESQACHPQLPTVQCLS